MLINRNLEKWQDKIVYEWQKGFYVHCDCPDCLAARRKNNQHQRDWKRLVRTQRDHCGVVLDQSYAYVKDGTLPKFFDGGQGDIYRVPQRFQKELEPSK